MVCAELNDPGAGSRAGVDSCCHLRSGRGRLTVSFVGRLDPDESFGEILAGLIMVLTFTLAAGVMSRDGEDGAHTVLFAAIGCNLAWGIIDAVFYIMTNAFVRRRRARLFRAVSAAANEDDP